MKEIFCCLRYKVMLLVVCFTFPLFSQEKIFDEDSSNQMSVIKSCFLDVDLKQGEKKNYHERDLMFYNSMNILKRSRFIYYIENNFFSKEYPVIRLEGDVDINDKNFYKYEHTNIVFTDGILRVNKNVKGAIAVFNGRVIIDPKSGYENYIYLYNSYLQVDSSFKNFFIICANDDQIAVFENTQALQFAIKKSEPYRIYDELMGGVTFKYNRVEGPFFGVNLSKNFYWDGANNYSYSGKTGYGFGNHRWTGSLAFDYWMGNEDRIEFGGEIFSVTDSKDNWKISTLDNTLHAFFIHEDFKDYFLREGFLFQINKYFAKAIKFGIAFTQNNYKTQQKNYDWALFGGNKKFRDNPSVSNGIIRSFVFSFNYKNDNSNYYLNGWDINYEFEIANGVSNYNRIFLDVQNYLFLKNIIPFINNNRTRFNTRLLFGTADKTLPFQKSFDIGGFGTVPATGFNILRGNKMLLTNFELSYPILELFGLEYSGLIESYTSVIISYDFGFVCNSLSNNIFDGFNINKETVLHGTTIALGAFNDKVRLGVAFRLDKQESPRLFFKLIRPF